MNLAKGYLFKGQVYGPGDSTGAPKEVIEFASKEQGETEPELAPTGMSTPPAALTASGELPLDFPARDSLVTAGITTLARVTEMSDNELTAVPHVGKAMAQKIREAAKK